MGSGLELEGPPSANHHINPHALRARSVATLGEWNGARYCATPGRPRRAVCPVRAQVLLRANHPGALSTSALARERGNP
jgi:hypothetical protein